MFNFRISMNKKILALAIPSIISNITVPLLGLVDVTIVGHLGSPLYIGAIAVGGMLFNMIYWLFAFLRMGTSGLTSQAYGKRDLQDVATLFIRAMAVGFGIALLLGLYLEYGSFRSGIRDSAGSICRFVYGIHVMAPVLQTPMEVY